MIKYFIKYEGKDVTKDFADKLISLEYTDILEGRASSLSLKLEDKDKLFLNSWYPKTDDKIEVLIVDEKGLLLNCGIFYVDEFESNISRQGITAEVKALSLSANKIYNKTRIKQYVGKNFSDVAKEIADELEMKIKGDLKGKVNFNSTKTGLAFLLQLSRRFGYVMKIENNILNFESYQKLKKRKSFALEYGSNIIKFNIKDKAEGRYNKCTCKWWDAKTRSLFSGSFSLGIKGGEALIWEACEDDSDAEQKAEKWLEDKNKQTKKINLTISGSAKFLAGVKVELKNFGKIDDNYIIAQCVHNISRVGYLTEIEIIK